MKTLAFLSTLACALAPLAANAADADASGFRLFGRQTDLSVGVGTVVAPRYFGSKDDRAQPVPVLAARSGVVFFDTVRGLGVQIQTDGGFYASQSFGYDLGRLDRNSSWRPGSNTLAGMGDVPGSVTSRTMIAQQFNQYLMLNAEAEVTLKDGARRNNYRAGAKLTLLQNDRDTVTMDLDAHGGDHRYNQAYFGVTQAQSARSRFATYSAGSGFYAYSVGANWDHALSKHWSSSLTVVGTRYIDNADGSPIVQRRAFASGVAAVTYTF
ncbi:MipA/OmpV family protein [Xanthomonas sp. AmX2]|uniref:MipA/OmpV family protein n=1 Tax=Xanthomonas sp. TaxID=29446 RepID=UPI00197D0C51|nr:MipA/OmpV family protein [Xanthomonas sp.]MBN6151859.1 MipA/OmpV family protein [Xanthomonas sp.]